MKVVLLTVVVLLLSLGAEASQRLTPLAKFKYDRNIEYNDVWGYTAPDQREYALLGVVDGTAIIDITDASSPNEISFIPSNRSTWKDIKTLGHYAYVVNESGGGMQIIDLSKLPEVATLAATFTDFSTSHNLWIDTDRKILFAEGDHAQPVKLYSLENPLAPTKLSFLGVECHDIYARDGLVYVSEGGHGTIGIFNYDDPANPTLVKRFQIQRAGYVHNAWPTTDNRYLMTTEENSGKTMKMFDLSDLRSVQKVGEVLAPGSLAHNVHIKGDYAFVSHYGSGLRIYDVSNPSSMNEVAFWQEGERSQTGFVSVWGAFPFFKSGKILASSIEEGLYIFQHDSARE